MKASYAGATSLLLLLLLVVVSASGGSLLQPLLERRGRSSIPESWFPDPFRVLEQVPFPLDRDDDVLGAVSLARVDWKETPHAHFITVDVPGMKREEVKVEVGENGVVTVSGERKREEESKDERWHCVERAAGRFWRQFRLPEDADLDSVGAKLEEGVLTVTVPKLPRERIKGPRVVAVGGEDKLPVGEGKEKKEKEKEKEKEKKKVEL